MSGDRDIIDTIEDASEKHYIWDESNDEPRIASCRCDVDGPSITNGVEDGGWMPWSEYHEHFATSILAALRAGGYAVVKLPRPQPDRHGNQGFRAGDGEFADFVLPLPDGDVFDGEYTWTPAEARARAAALWAGADKAEEGK